jgi:hypothetical protein
MTPWTTRRGKRDLPNPGAPVSATLLYHKWHAYDSDGSFGTKKSRLEFLDRVAALANGALAGYPAWYDRYFQGLKALGVDRERAVVSAKTVWRLVAGFATNPALETGLSLHLLQSFPYLPGSAVRGLVRRVAEYELVKGCQTWFELPKLPSEEDIDCLLTEAKELRALLGSLAVDPPDPAPADPLWRTPRELLLHLRSRLDPEAGAAGRAPSPATIRGPPLLPAPLPKRLKKGTLMAEARPRNLGSRRQDSRRLRLFQAPRKESCQPLNTEWARR